MAKTSNIVLKIDTKYVNSELKRIEKKVDSLLRKYELAIKKAKLLKKK